MKCVVDPPGDQKVKLICHRGDYSLDFEQTISFRIQF